MFESIENKQETINKIFRDTIVTILSEEYPYLAEVIEEKNSFKLTRDFLKC